VPGYQGSHLRHQRYCSRPKCTQVCSQDPFAPNAQKAHATQNPNLLTLGLYCALTHVCLMDSSQHMHTHMGPTINPSTDDPSATRDGSCVSTCVTDGLHTTHAHQHGSHNTFYQPMGPQEHIHQSINSRRAHAWLTDCTQYMHTGMSRTTQSMH
jgi:hypothetical protein